MPDQANLWHYPNIYSSVVDPIFEPNPNIYCYLNEMVCISVCYLGTSPLQLLGFGEGDLASTHILKFGTKPDMHLVINEFICMELARMAKLPVAPVSLARYGEPVLAYAVGSYQGNHL